MSKLQNFSSFSKLKLILNQKDRFLVSNMVINLITGISLLMLKIEMGHQFKKRKMFVLEFVIWF
jgi:hypothetical protein